MVAASDKQFRLTLGINYFKAQLKSQEEKLTLLRKQLRELRPHRQPKKPMAMDMEAKPAKCVPPTDGTFNAIDKRVGVLRNSVEYESGKCLFCHNDVQNSSDETTEVSLHSQKACVHKECLAKESFGVVYALFKDTFPDVSSVIMGTPVVTSAEVMSEGVTSAGVTV
jgi:hypothetical protein